jgi:uncharacterized integral membrane protein
MRQVNFVIIFVICLALVLFGIENTEPAVIKVVQGVQWEAPLSIELILAMGIGATMAWVFSVWTSVQRMMVTRQEIGAKDTRIEELEQDIERYKAEIQEQQLMLPASQTAAEESTDAEVYAQS